MKWIATALIVACTTATALSLVALVFISGCRSETIKTAIPRTNLEVQLDGPDLKDHYRYIVIENGTIVAERFLGPAQVISKSVPTIADDGKGRVTLTWGSGRGAAFTTIDTKNRLIVEDTNQANQRNHPFQSKP